VAIGKKAAPAKEAEKRKPDFVVRAKVKEDVWVTIGAAWSAKLKDGVTGSHVHGLVHPPGDVPFDFVDERPFLVPTGRERVPDLPALVCRLIAHRDRF